MAAYSTVLIFILGILGFIVVTLFAGKIIRPNKPNKDKQTTYESGEAPEGMAFGAFNVRYYIVALVFLLFEAELIFLFPWATVFGDQALIHETNGLWAKFTLVEVFVFIFVLAVGLVYIWKKGMLDWVKPPKPPKATHTHIPKELYEKINQKYD